MCISFPSGNKCPGRQVYVAVLPLVAVLSVVVAFMRVGSGGHRSSAVDERFMLQSRCARYHTFTEEYTAFYFQEYLNLNQSDIISCMTKLQ